MPTKPTDEWDTTHDWIVVNAKGRVATVKATKAEALEFAREMTPVRGSGPFRILFGPDAYAAASDPATI